MIIDCRSALFMPASNARALAKGPVLAADAVIVDLEDSITPDSKAEVRDKAVQALQQNNYGYRLRALRVNAADTPWHSDDLTAAALCSPDALVLPKVECVDDVATICRAMDQHMSLANTGLWVMMESPLSVLNAADIARSVSQFPRLASFMVGNNDMARTAGIPVQSDRTHMLPWLMTLVAAAKSYGLQILDGVYNDFADITGFEAECRQGVNMGMSGKALIHPSQLEIANAAYAPSDADIKNATAIVKAFALTENNSKGAISINGRMVERLHLDIAVALLQRVERLSKRM